MIGQKTMDALKSIGLNLYERKLWVALLARGTSTAGELSEMANVPRSRSYDVLESLAEKGFVVIQHAKPLKYVAISPEQALDRAKVKLKEKLETSMTRIDEFKKTSNINELKTLHSKGVDLVEPADLSGSLKGRASLHQHLGTMLKAATSSVNIITTEDGLKELQTGHMNLLKNAKEKGIAMKIVAPVTNANKDAVKALSGIAKVKNLADESKLPATRIAIIDGKQVIMALTDDKKTHSSQDVAFWTASNHFADNFAQATFNMIWNQLK